MQLPYLYTTVTNMECQRSAPALAKWKFKLDAGMSTKLKDILLCFSLIIIRYSQTQKDLINICQIHLCTIYIYIYIYIYAAQQDTQSVLMSEFIHHVCSLDMFRISPVHHQERFVQAVFADLVCGNTRTTRHVQPLRSCRKNTYVALKTKSQQRVSALIALPSGHTQLIIHTKT